MSNYTVPAIVCTLIILISKELYFIWHLTESKDLLWIQIVHCMLSVNPISLELWEQSRIKCSLDQFTHKLLKINVRYRIVFWRHYTNIGNVTLIANTRVIISVSRIRKRCLKSCTNERKCLLQDSTLLTPPWLSANYWPNNIRILNSQDGSFRSCKGNRQCVSTTQSNMSKYDSKSYISPPQLSHQSTISINCLDVQ